jgi:hypothetical protein
MFKNESGFSLVELATAAAIALAVGGLAISTLQPIIGNVSTQAVSGAAEAQTSLDESEDLISG